MLLSAHQPAYLPWPGYLDKIRQADIFVVLDTVNRSKGDWSNRNRIKTQNGVQTLTVPVQRDKVPLSRVMVDPWNRWRPKHFRALELAYESSPYWWAVREDLEWVYRADSPHTLCAVTDATTMILCDHFGIQTETVYASRLDTNGTKNSLLLNLCAHYEADQFLFGAQGRDYCDFEAFDKAGVEPVFQEYECREYPQLHGEFEPGLSALDMLMVCGTQAKDYL